MSALQDPQFNKDQLNDRFLWKAWKEYTDRKQRQMSLSKKIDL